MKTLLETILSRKLFDPKVAIYDWLEKYGIKNYTVNDKGEIDVYGDVDLDGYNLTEFPSYIQFGTVKGGFYCYNNKLTSLEGVPKVIEGGFDCSHNNLKDLKGSPREVGENFDCSLNSTQFTENDVRKVCRVRMRIIV